MVATVLHGSTPMAPPASNQNVPRDLYRFIYALSGACERDCNVLRDGKLVDHLESQAKQIIRARRQHRSSSMASSSSLSSSSSSASQRTTSPLLKPVTNTVSSSNVVITKRRKLPSEKGLNKTPVLFGRSGDADKENADEASLVMARGDGSSAVIPAVKISKLARPQVLSSLKAKDMSSVPLDKLSSKASRKSVDLGASMSSTVSSASMRQYELSDAEDANPSATTPTARYASAKSVYDYDDYTPAREVSRRSSAFSEDQTISPTTDLDDSLLHVSELGFGSSRRKDSCYSEGSASSFVGPKKLRFEVDALSLYENEQGLHMSSSSSIKNVESNLVETLQSQVDLLLSENVKALAENARLLELSQMSAAEAEELALERLRALKEVKQRSTEVEEIQQRLMETELRANTEEGLRRDAELAFQAELNVKTQLLTSLQSQIKAKEDEINHLSKRVEDITGLFGSKVRESVSRRSSLTTLKELPGDDIEEVVEIPSGDDMLLELEVQKLRSTLLEKDREICNLYMHLSTKKKLIEEITKKFVQHMEEAAVAAKNTAESSEQPSGAATANFTKEGVRFDLDMFLFKNVVDKQRQVEELTAALGVMDREVEGLEARVAEKELENTQLRENQVVLTRRLQTVNAQVCRVQSENERLDSEIEGKQSQIATLIASLEEKEQQIHQLGEQLELSQTQIDHLMSSNDKLSASGRRSLKNSLFKPRSSQTSAAKSSGSRSSFMNFSSNRDAEDDSEQRSSVSSLSTSQRKSAKHRTSSADTMSYSDLRSSADWTGARRSSVLSSQPTSAAAAERASMKSECEFAPKRNSLLSQMLDDISAPLDDIDDGEKSLFGLEPSSPGEIRSTRASYCASEINDDEELFNELFAKA